MPGTPSLQHRNDDAVDAGVAAGLAGVRTNRLLLALPAKQNLLHHVFHCVILHRVVDTSQRSFLEALSDLRREYNKFFWIRLPYSLAKYQILFAMSKMKP